MRKLQSQGVHHITIVGADRQTSIHFWEGVLGMPFIFEQPNLDNASESHRVRDLASDVRPDGGAPGMSAGSPTAGSRTAGSWTRSYFEDPLGLLIELASYRFEPPAGHTHADVLLEAHRQRYDHNIGQVHLADAIETLSKRLRQSLSDDGQ